MTNFQNTPELAYLTPTTREKAILLAQQLVSTKNYAPADAIRLAILQAESWAVKSINRNVWKRLKQSDQELL